MVNDRSISFCSTIAWVMTGVSFLLFIAACALKFCEADEVAFVVCCAFIAAIAMASVAHIRTYFCSQNQLLRLLLAAQRGAQDGELHSI